VKKTGLFLLLVASLVLGLVAVPGFAVASDVPTTSESTMQPLSCSEGLPALATYNARMRRYASITAAAYPVVVPHGAVVPAVAMDHTGGWLLICYAGVVGWSSRDLYRPGADWVLFQTLPIVGADVSAAPGPGPLKDSDGDGFPDLLDFCPTEHAGYAVDTPEEVLALAVWQAVGFPTAVAVANGWRLPPYTGCPHADALTQCLNYSPTGVCVNLIAGVVDLATYGTEVVQGTCMFVDVAQEYSILALGEGCWVPVVATAFGNTQFIVRAYATETVGDVLAGSLFEGWAQTDAFGPVAGDLALVPSY